MGNFWRDEAGAVAATYGIAILPLIVVAGVGYDYSRMVSLDSELQNAADQAALAAVTQLDRQPGACERASNAAVGLLSNLTMLSNDGSGNQITVTAETACDATGRIRFYQDKEKATPATTDEEARFVEVHVDPREAFYALTPVMATFSGSGDLHAAAYAGIGSAICRVPPLMICNPIEPATNTDTLLDFPAEAYVGAGIKLVANDSYTPGAFGFLQTEFGTGANGLLAALGWDVRGGDCVSVDGVEVKTGMNTSVLDGINARFDLPGTGQYCPAIDGIAGVCSPSVAVRKDLTRPAGSDSWSVHEGNSGNFDTQAYRPTTADFYPSTKTPLIMGLPRDRCHAFSNDGNCNSVNGGNGARLGTGDWDINAYWRSANGANYGSQISATEYGPQPKGYPTRYQVYRWEADQIVNGSLTGISKSAGGGRFAYAQPQAGRSLALANDPYGLVPGSDLDRRRISVAVLNCRALQAKLGTSLNNEVLEVPTWIDIFLVEPTKARKKCQGGPGCNTTYTELHDVYVELIERTDIGGDNGSVSQTIRRDVPYLIE